MAQLDKFTFFDQSFLVFTFFFIIYIFHARILLPKIASNIKIRTKLLTIIINDNSLYNDIYSTIYIYNKYTNIILLNFLNLKYNILNSYIHYFVKYRKI